ncbi:MAG: leucyl aminopeptidase [Zetaproteobacteria bacterium]|nr:MAG: leucyl aminopeptidase [Zetaproteobacteria bacterium]
MIEIAVKAGAAHKQRNDAVVLPMFEGRKLAGAAAQLVREIREVKGYLRKFDHLGTFGRMGVLYDVPGMHTPRLLFAGAGEERRFDLHALRRLAARAARWLQESGARDAALYLTDVPLRGTTLAERVQAVAEGVWLGLYRFDKYQGRKQEQKRPLRAVTIMIPSRRDLAVAEQAVTRARAVAQGTYFARDLANEPGNVCTPEYLAEQAAALADDRLRVTVMDKKAIEQAGFTALLAVNQGSDKEPRFIVLEYRGADEDEAPVALVGKGLTFDAGGISLKPAAQMDEMKFDMCGAAAVLGTFRAARELALPVNLLGVIASTENLPGGSAYKPGDVVRTYKGLTVEVQNTDAEGRLILADALAYAAERKPAEIIDLATLTGACVIALGSQASGLLGNEERLLRALRKAGERTHDRVWPLPLFDEYQEQLKSKIADLRNIGGREAGTITAACFLSRFVDDIPWAHLDIAGTAWNMKGSELAHPGATGAGVRVLVEYLRMRAEP